MHILIDGRVITDRFPGIGRYTYQLAGALADREAVQITLLIDRVSPSTRYDLNALARSHPRLKLRPVDAPAFSFKEQTQVAPVARSVAYDIWHSQHYAMPFFGVPGPIVLTLHDLIPLVKPQYWSGPSRWLYRWMHRLALRAAARIITPSIATQTDLIRLFGVKPDRIRVVPEAVDDRFRPASIDQVTALKSKYQLPVPYLLYVGINKPPKNLVRLIEAYARVVQQNSNFAYDCVVAGAWDDRYPQAQQRSGELGLADRVHFIGSIADADLPALYSSADVFVTASLYEGFGLPILEAMACGTPVISSRASSLPEVIGDAGLLFDPTDVEAIAIAIQQIASDSQLRMNLKQRGFDRAKQFTWAQAADRTIEVYQEAIS